MFLDPSDIDYIESRDGKVQIHVNNETYEHDATLQSMEALILPYGFYRCHRSYIINLQKLKKLFLGPKFIFYKTKLFERFFNSYLKK